MHHYSALNLKETRDTSIRIVYPVHALLPPPLLLPVASEFFSAVTSFPCDAVLQHVRGSRSLGGQAPCSGAWFGEWCTDRAREQRIGFGEPFKRRWRVKGCERLATRCNVELHLISSEAVILFFVTVRSTDIAPLPFTIGRTCLRVVAPSSISQELTAREA